MTKVVIIGAGSGFGSRISVDILTRIGNLGVEIVLCDIDGKKAKTVEHFVQKVIDTHDLKGKVWSTTDRLKALPDADFVIISVAIGGPAYYDEPFDSEMAIPEKYGIHQTVADTIGPGALFRFLRTAPAMLEMVRDINRLAPASVVLNLTNPMAMLTWSLSKYSEVPFIGLCHGVTHNIGLISERMGIDRDEVYFVCAGINHMTWFTQIRHNGKDILDKVFETVMRYTQEERHSQDWAVRKEVYKEFGYFPTESDRHILEYVPWFQHGDPRRIDEYAAVTRGIKGARQTWYEDMGVKTENADSLELTLSHESASGIIMGLVTGKPFEFSGNVINHGYIENLPLDCCVEVPCTADGNGIHPHTVGRIPTQCAALCQTGINEQALAVEAFWEHDRQKAFQALLLDPETTSKLTIQRCREMFEEMWKREVELGLELI